MEVAVETQANKANQQLDQLISKLNKVASSLNSVNGSGLTGLSNGVQRLSAAMKSMNGVKTTDFTRLANNIGKLSTLNTSGLNSAASSMSHLTRTLNGMGAVSANAVKIGELAKNISKLGNANVQKAMTNMPVLAAALNNLMVTLSKAPKVSSNLVQLVNALARFSSQGTGAVNTIRNIGTASSNGSGNLRKLADGLNVFSGHAEKVKRTNLSLAASFGIFYASFFPIIRGIKYLWRSIESSMNYIETFNYFNVTMDKIGQEFSDQYGKFGYASAEAYANSFSERLNDLTQQMSGFKVNKNGVLDLTNGMNLGLDPEQIMNYQSGIAAVTNSVGLMGETSVNAAKALSMLAADMSSFKNVDLKTVMTNMQSGLIGQSRALYKYGIDITNATLQTYAYKYGIETAVSEMTQADKMQLRLLAILDQSRIAWGDQANTINSVANQYRILKQQVSNVARMIGNLLMPIIQKALPVINGIVIAIQRLLTFVGGLLGIDFGKIMDGISSGYSGADDFTDGMEDVSDSAGDTAGGLEDANKAAKKLKNTLFGFDEMNVLPDDTDYDSAVSDGGGTGVGGGGVDLSDAIGNALKEYEDAWNRAFESSKNKAQEYADAISSAFKKIWDTAEPTRKAVVRLWDEGLSKFKDFTFDTLKDFWNNLLKPIGNWMLGDESGLPRFFNITNDLLNEIDWERLRSSLADFYEALQKPAKFAWTGLMDFYEHFLKPVAVWTMGVGIPQLVDALTQFVEKIHWDKINKSLRNFWGALAPFAKSVGQGLIDFFKGLLKVGADFINKVVPGGLDALANALKKIKPETAEKIGKALGGLFVAILAFKGIGSAIKKLADFGTKLKVLKEGLGALFGSKGIVKDIKNGFGALFETNGLFGSGGIIISGLTKVKEAFALLTGVTVPIGIVAAAIVTVGAALIDLWKTSETFRDTMKMAFGNVWDSLKESFSKIGSAISKVWGKIKELGKALYDFYENSGLKKAVEILAELLAVLVSIAASTVFKQIASAFDMLADVLGGVLDMATGFIEILTGILTLDPDLILEGFRKIGEGIEDVFTGLVDWVESWFTDFWTSIPDKLIEALASLPGKLYEWAQNVYETMSTEIRKVIDGTVQFFAELPDKIGYAIGFAAGKFVSWAAELSETIGKYIPKVIDKVQKFFFEVPGKIWDAIISTVAKLGQWGMEMLAKVAEVIPKIPKAIADFFKDLPKNLYDIGKNLILGFFKGIADFVKDVYNKVADFVKNVIQGFKDGFDVHSPSRVLYGIGENVVKGFSNALTDKWGGVQKQLKSLVSSASKTLENGLNSIWNHAKSAVSSIQSLFSNIKLPHVTVNWNKLTVGKNTVSIPSFGINYYANGGFPNSGELFMARENGINEMVGRMGSRSTVANNDQIVNGIAAGIGPAVYDAVVSALSSSGNASGDPQFNIYVGGRKITDVVVEEVNKITKSTGNCPILT